MTLYNNKASDKLGLHISIINTSVGDERSTDIQEENYSYASNVNQLSPYKTLS
jgi:hypothetical protein